MEYRKEKPKILHKAWRAGGVLVYGDTRAKARHKAIWASDAPYKDCFEYYSVCRRSPDYDMIENKVHELAHLISDEQKSDMVHALGERRDGLGFTGHRNRFITHEDAQWEDLVTKGFAGKQKFQMVEGTQEYAYFVTKLGEDVLASVYPITRFLWEEKNMATIQPVEA